MPGLRRSQQVLPLWHQGYGAKRILPMNWAKTEEKEKKVLEELKQHFSSENPGNALVENSGSPYHGTLGGVPVSTSSKTLQSM